MINRIDNNQILNIQNDPSSKQAQPAKVPTPENIDASLHTDYDSLLQKAIQTPQTDANIVQEAQKLISSGLLETPENIRAAAENILTFGI